MRLIAIVKLLFVSSLVVTNFILIYIFSDHVASKRPLNLENKAIDIANEGTTLISGLQSIGIGSKIVDSAQFEFVLNPKRACSSHPDMVLLVAIASTPSHFSCRDVIRRTWGDRKLYKKTKTVVIFFLGKIQDENVTRVVEGESQRYGDIVLQNFTDSYLNLTLKSISILQWASKYCSKTWYVLKTDDDTLINVFELSKYLWQTLNTQTNGYTDRFICYLMKNVPVVRNNRSKWFVSIDEYKNNKYPEYCIGLGYVIGRNLLATLYNASRYIPVFKIEDVYVSGILREHIKAQMHGINTKYFQSVKHADKVINGAAYILEIGHNDPNRVNLWNKLKKKYT